MGDEGAGVLLDEDQFGNVAIGGVREVLLPDDGNGVGVAVQSEMVPGIISYF